MNQGKANHGSSPPYVDFRKSRLYLGRKFWIAITLIFASVAVYIAADPSKQEGRVALGVVALGGIIIGLLLQPSPKPVDHRPRARQALQNVATGIELIIDVQTLAAQLPGSDPENIRLGIAVANIDTDLGRARRQLTNSMAAWDEVAPGAVSEFAKLKHRGSEILAELALEEGTS